MDVLDVAKKINLKIKELEELKTQLSSTSQEKAVYAADYDKILAQTIIGLKNGKVYQIETEIIHNPAISIMEKLAKGLCWKEKLLMDSSEAKYKNTLKIVDITEAQLNGYQSINRYLAEV